MSHECNKYQLTIVETSSIVPRVYGPDATSTSSKLHPSPSFPLVVVVRSNMYRGLIWSFSDILRRFFSCSQKKESGDWELAGE